MADKIKRDMHDSMPYIDVVLSYREGMMKGTRERQEFDRKLNSLFVLIYDMMQKPHRETLYWSKLKADETATHWHGFKITKYKGDNLLPIHLFDALFAIILELIHESSGYADSDTTGKTYDQNALGIRIQTVDDASIIQIERVPLYYGK